jgi:membrane protease YdiL (CAAX protease family)
LDRPEQKAVNGSSGRLFVPRAADVRTVRPVRDDGSMTRSDRHSPAHDAAVASVAMALVPALLVVLAAAERPLRVPVLVLVVAGLALACVRGSPASRAAWGAPLPVAVLLVLALAPEPTALGSGVDCGALAPLRVVRRVLEAGAVLGVTAVTWRLAGLPGAALRLGRPSAAVGAASLAFFVAAVVLAVVLGPALAEPFFGPVGLRFPGLVALLPLLVGALANAVQEEVAYRGAWLGWGEIALGPALALACQAVAFGLAHAGSDFTGPQAPVVLAMAAGGLLAGLIARRTGSLAIPIAIHAAADVPMLLYAVCGSA